MPSHETLIRRRQREERRAKELADYERRVKAARYKQELEEKEQAREALAEQLEAAISPRILERISLEDWQNTGTLCRIAVRRWLWPWRKRWSWRKVAVYRLEANLAITSDGIFMQTASRPKVKVSSLKTLCLLLLAGGFAADITRQEIDEIRLSAESHPAFDQQFINEIIGEYGLGRWWTEKPIEDNPPPAKKQHLIDRR